MKEQIKELRVRIDGLAQLTKELKPIKSWWIGEPIPNTDKISINSKEVDKAYDSLILAKAWLGKVLGELGEQTPYANDGKRKTVEDIEPTADVFPKEKIQQQLNKIIEEVSDIADKEDLYDKQTISELISFGSNWNTKSHIEKVDWLRQEIEILTKVILPMHPNGEWQRHFLYEQKAYEYLCEARFWLGFELQRIKESFQTHIIKEEGIKINK